MANPLEGLLLKVLRVPPEPTDPLGIAEEVLVFRASPKYFQYRLVLWAIGKIIATIVALGVLTWWHFGVVPEAEGYEGILHLLGLVAAIAYLVHLVFSYVLLRLDYKMRWYKVSDRSLRIREGVMNVREMTMTFANVQNLSITQGPIQRALGISDLKVQTAGGGSSAADQQQQQVGTFSMHEGYFRGVDNAERIRNIIQEKLRLARGSGLGDLDERNEEDEEPAEGGAMALPAEMLPALIELRNEARAFRAVVERV